MAMLTDTNITSFTGCFTGLSLSNMVHDRNDDRDHEKIERQIIADKLRAASPQSALAVEMPVATNRNGRT